MDTNSLAAFVLFFLYKIGLIFSACCPDDQMEMELKADSADYFRFNILINVFKESVDDVLRGSRKAVKLTSGDLITLHGDNSLELNIKKLCVRVKRVTEITFVFFNKGMTSQIARSTVRVKGSRRRVCVSDLPAGVVGGIWIKGLNTNSTRSIVLKGLYMFACMPNKEVSEMKKLTLESL